MYISTEQLTGYCALYLAEHGEVLDEARAFLLLNQQVGLHCFLFPTDLDQLIYAQEESIGICRRCVPEILYQLMLEEHENIG